MSHKLTNKFLSIPIIVWVAQLFYVVVALLLYVILLWIINTGSILINVAYVVLMLIINIIWRIAIMKKHPEWF